MYLRYGIRKDGMWDSWLLGSRKEISNFSKVGWFRKPLNSFCRGRECSEEFFFFNIDILIWYVHVTLLWVTQLELCAAFLWFSFISPVWWDTDDLFSYRFVTRLGFSLPRPAETAPGRPILTSLLVFLALFSVYFAFRLNRASPFLWMLCHCLVSRLSPLLSQQFLLWSHFQVCRAVQEYPSCSLGLAILYSKALRKSFVLFFKLFTRVWGTRLSEASVREKIRRADAGQKSLAGWKLLLCFENRHEFVIVGDPRG